MPNTRYYQYANLREGKVQPCCVIRNTDEGNKALHFRSGPSMPITAVTPEGLAKEVEYWLGQGYAIFDEIQFKKGAANGFITEVEDA